MCNIKDVCCNLVSVKWSIASWMSSKLEPVIWLRVLVTLAYMKGRTDVRTYVRMYVRTLYVRTDVHDVMAIKPNFLTSMGYHIFLSMVLRARSSATKVTKSIKKMLLLDLFYLLKSRSTVENFTQVKSGRLSDDMRDLLRVVTEIRYSITFR